MSARTTTEADVNFARLLDLLSTFRRRDEVSGVVYADKGKLPEAVSLTNTAPGGFSEARGIITP